MIDSMKIEAPLGKSDHVTLIFNLTTYSDNSKHKRNKNIHKANFDNISCKFNGIDWMTVFKNISTQEAWNVFLKIYTDIIQRTLQYTQYLKGKKGSG